MKTQPQIQKMYAKKQKEKLRQISQHYIDNAFYAVRFHQANDRGIHGATPSEMLHAVLLGIFKYLRDIFFELMGKESETAHEINGLAKLYGKLFKRQSDRTFPKTNFAKGIMSGKLMGKEFRGVLLNMAAILASTKGRNLLGKKRKFGQDVGLADWTLLVELLLQWEAYLNQDKMKRSDVMRLGKKQRYIMYIMACVAKRTKGMGLKIMKYHAIVHMVQDMILYGVPTEFDTGSNESHHKPTKFAAKLTQRKESTFNIQAVRL